MKKSILIGLIIIILLGAGFVIYRSGTNSNANYQELTVTKGAIIQQVNVTGQIKPAQSVDLAFERAGKVVGAYVKVGDQVQAGQLLVALDSADLQAQVAQAQAALASQEARLDELKAGARPEELQVAQLAVDTAASSLRTAQVNLDNAQSKAQSDLATVYASAFNTLSDAQAKADDAINHQTDDLFINDTSSNPTLTYITSDVQAQTDAQWQRYVVGLNLQAFNQELSQLSSGQAAIEQELVKAQSYINGFLTFFNRLSETLNDQASVSQATLATYRSEVNTARTSLNTLLVSLTSQKQAITNQKIANTNALASAQASLDSAKNSLASAQSQLILKQAGATPQAIAGQAAQVRQAQATLASDEAQLAKTSIRAPLAGLVTRQEAKVAQIASPSATLISIISQNSLDIEANVPEVDISKVSIGNPVSITLDALPGETFMGKVVHIDPAQTIVDGVSNFKIRITFDQADLRFKSGLTANLGVQTLKKDDVLLLPQVAVVENDKGTFVQEKQGNAIKELPITVGIRGESGNLEILSGVKEGEKVLNVGLKTTP